MECSFDAAILGSYFGRELSDAQETSRRRITDVPYAIGDPRAYRVGHRYRRQYPPSGFSRSSGPNLHVIDHYEASGFALGHYVDVFEGETVISIRSRLPARTTRWRVNSCTGRSNLPRTMKALSGRHPWITRKLSIMDGINAARVTLAKTWFDAENCHDGLEALRAYHAEFDERAKVFSDRPKHDWSSHDRLTCDVRWF